jgi:hemerythrin-like domain-containing protein
MNSMMILTAEHDLILEALSVMETAIELDRRGVDIGDNTWQIFVDFISDFADEYHHAKEEGILFPAYCKKGMSSDYGPIAIMIREHEQIRRFSKRMEEALVLGPPFDNSMWIPASRYIEYLRLHIGKENEILYPIGANLLDGGDEEEIISKFNELDASYGANTSEHFREIISSLNENMTSIITQLD